MTAATASVPAEAGTRVKTKAGAPASGGSTRLAPVPPPIPHGRLGVLWGLLTAAAVFGGRWSLAGWLAVGALVAVLGLARTRQVNPVTAAGAVAAALGGPLLAALVGGWAALAGLLGAAVLGLFLARRRDPASWLTAHDPANLVTGGGLALGLCGASLVLLQVRSVTLIAVILAFACCHDASRYLVGWGAPSVWEGRVAGVAAVGSATLVVAVVQPTPVSGAYPWILGGLVAAGGCLGGPLVARIEGGSAVGPLRRLDTLLVAAPAVLLMALAGHR
ncbi:MAG TPA: hypothetical protein VMU63_02695 [Acidimicrobiales bacterium]|nr:hypothetical protein [Acidimicrobiales bacterium]